MKKLILAAGMLLATGATHAQITLEHSYLPERSPLQMVLLSQSGYKYMVTDTGANVVKLYNTDHTLWKSINVPAISGYKFSGTVWAVSDNLFNNDNLVELAVGYSSLTGYGYRGLIINENGSTVYDLQGASNGTVFDENGTFKLMAYTVNYVPATNSSFIQSDVYSLPGTMPCGACGGLGSKNLQRQTGTLLNAVPNPATGSTSIGYVLPLGQSGTLTIINTGGQQVCSYPLTGGSGTINVQVGTLPPGNYFYTLTTADGLNDTRQLAIVK